MIIGLTGSLGSGKSVVAEMLRDLVGAPIIDADAIAHEVQSPGGSAYGAVVDSFGRAILAADGTIDRQRLAAAVFADPEKRKLLNSIVHPRVREKELQLLELHRHEPVVVLMVPLLLENRMQELVDKVVVVTVDEESRCSRLAARSGMQPEEVRRRLAAHARSIPKARSRGSKASASSRPARARRIGRCSAAVSL